MSISKFFGNSAAAIALAGSALTLPATPAEAQRVPTQVQPQSCRLLDQEYQRVAREDSYARQRSARNVGWGIQNALRNGRVDEGQIIGSIVGGEVERRMASSQNSPYIKYLKGKCDAEIADLEAGICVTSQRETGSIETRNGQMVGEARGRIQQQRECTSTSVGNGRSILTPNGGSRMSGSAYDRMGYRP